MGLKTPWKDVYVFGFNAQRTLLTTSVATVLAILSGCGAGESEFVSDGPGSSSSRAILYVASGSCYAGGATVPTGSALITRFRASDGANLGVVFDYSTFPGDQPVGIADYDSENLLVLVENTAGRRVELVKKNGGGTSTYIPPSAGLSAILRTIVRLTNGSILVSKSSAIEKYSPFPARSRVLQGAAPFISAPTGACAASATLISSMVPLSNGKILFSHAAATPNNKLVLISSTGYATGADCLTVEPSPTTTSLPTAMIKHSSGKLLVSYGSTLATSNLIQSYDINESTNVISNSTLSYSDPAILNGPSAMAEDPVTGDVFIANGATAMSNIVRYTIDSSTGVLTPSVVGTNSVYSKCVTAMKVISQ